MNDTFGGRLRALRKACRFTQQDISETLGIDRTTYSCYERNVTQPDAKTCSILAKIYGITISELIGEEIRPRLLLDSEHTTPEDLTLLDMDLPSTARLTELSKTERHLICLFRSFSDGQKSELLQDAFDLLNKKKENDP